MVEQTIVGLLNRHVDSQLPVQVDSVTHTASTGQANLTALVEAVDARLRETDGFRGFMMLAREGRAVGLSFWESREAAERQDYSRSQFRERMLAVANVRIEDVVDYEVVFSSL